MTKQVSKVFVISWRWSVSGVGWESEKTTLTDMLTKYAKKWVFQLEMTVDAKDGHENWHWQGYANLKEKKRPKHFAKSLNDEFPGIEIRAASTNGMEVLKNYCMKHESRMQGPWADKPIYLGADLAEVKGSPYPWQATLIAYCAGPVKEREIIWIYDARGAQGKSKFAKYMSFYKKASILAYSSTKDLLSQVAKTVSTIFILDLSRTKPRDIATEDLYAALEQIKNGSVFNQKYVTEQVNFDPPHVIVLSNDMPDKKRMSSDRFQTYLINADRQLARF